MPSQEDEKRGLGNSVQCPLQQGVACFKGNNTGLSWLARGRDRMWTHVCLSPRPARGGKRQAEGAEGRRRRGRGRAGRSVLQGGPVAWPWGTTRAPSRRPGWTAASPRPHIINDASSRRGDGGQP